MIRTRLTTALQLDHPIISAPMAFAAGGVLASAVSNAGGLGLIGGAYGDQTWLDEQFVSAGNTPVGCGFITWNLQNAQDDNPDILEAVLAHQPQAMMLSFGDPMPFAETILRAGVKLICQVQTVRDAKRAIDAGAHIVVAQGSEAGGHGESRATMTLVPEVADLLAKSAPEVLLCAAGGIADGRGLAAALMLGADGVLIGSRFWASEEAMVHPTMLQAALNAGGDDTIRSSVMDIARKLHWPTRYTARVLKNAFTDRWNDNINGLIERSDEQSALWKDAWAKGDTTIANTFVGEVTGLIDSVEPVAQIMTDIVEQAETSVELLSLNFGLIGALRSQPLSLRSFQAFCSDNI